VPRGTGSPRRPAAGKTLHLAIGVPVSLGGPTGIRLVQPQFVKLLFGR
jgi:hypothetical protein